MAGVGCRCVFIYINTREDESKHLSPYQQGPCLSDTSSATTKSARTSNLPSVPTCYSRVPPPISISSIKDIAVNRYSPSLKPSADTHPAAVSSWALRRSSVDSYPTLVDTPLLDAHADSHMPRRSSVDSYPTPINAPQLDAQLHTPPAPHPDVSSLANLIFLITLSNCGSMYYNLHLDNLSPQHYHVHTHNSPFTARCYPTAISHTGYFPMGNNILPPCCHVYSANTMHGVSFP